MMDNVSHKELLQKGIEEKSEEVRDIVERIPQTFTLVISCFLIFVVLTLAVLGFTINYPDLVSGSGTLNASQASVRLVMPSHGKILFTEIQQKQYVQDGQILASVGNSALVNDVMILKDLLNKNNPVQSDLIISDSLFPTTLSLGELSVAYYQYKNLLRALRNEMENSLYQQNIELTNNLTVEQKKSLKQLEIIKRTQYENLRIAQKSFRRDSLLYADNVIAQSDIERSKEKYLQAKRSYQQAVSDVINYKYTISSSLGKVQQLEIEKENHLFDLKTQVVSSYTILVSQLNEWEKRYLILAPISGQIEFLQFWTPNQYLPMGTEVFSVIPNGNLTRLEVAVPSDGVGKVKVGQEVIIKLEDYPYKEYGSVIGKVRDISLTKLPTEKANLTLVIVELVNGSTTNYDVKLNLKYGMKATAEIITEDKKLIERLFERIKHVARK